MSEYSDKIRVEWKAGDAKRDAGLTTPDDIKRYDNICYGPSEKWNVLDVYRPVGTEFVKESDKRSERVGCDPMPVIVNVHGGGWVYGDKELYQFYGMSLAERGFLVVNFTYRLAPENTFPAQVEDINMVIEWMFDNVLEYGFDMDKVFMVGDSAGAHLAALYSCICVNENYAKSFDIKVPNSFVPKALGLNCGCFAPVKEEAGQVIFTDDMHVELMEDLFGRKVTLSDAFLINVQNHITDKFPPSFLMSAEGDFCLTQTKEMEEVFKNNNVPHTMKIYGSEEKPLYHVFHVTIQEPLGQQCNDDECNFFKKFL